MLHFRSKVVACRLSPFPFPLSIAFGSPTYLYRLLSTSSTRATPSPTPSPSSGFAVQYLIKSCGLPSNHAARSFRYLPHLKTPDKPDAVLQFLRQAGVSEPHIKAAVWRDARLLCWNVEKCLQPKMAALQEIGFSSSDISLLLSTCPTVFALRALKQKIVRLIKLAPRLIASAPRVLKNKAKRAEQLGVRCSSAMYLHALKVVSSLNQSIIDARINKLRSLGFSHEEVIILVSKLPYVLTNSEDIMTRKVEILTKEAGCDKLYLVTNPALLTYSIEKRLIPRNLVTNVLKLKGLPVADQKLCSFMKKTEKQFVEKFVLPFEPDIPGFLRAYKEACAGNVARLEWFKSHSC